MAKREPEGWMTLEIDPEIDRIARERCAGYQFDSSKSMAEIMRDCWIQGFLDRDLLGGIDKALGIAGQEDADGE